MDTQQLMPLILSGIASLAVLFLLSGIRQTLDDRTRRKLLAARTSGARGGAGLAAQPSTAAWLSQGLSSMFAHLGESTKPKNREEADRTRLSLVRAGYRQANAPIVFWGVKCVLALVGMGGFGVAWMLVLRDQPVMNSVIGGLLCATCALYLPELWLRMAVASRQKAITNAVPDALDLLVVCVEAGMGLDAAINRVAHEMRATCPILSDEFRMLTLELRAGKSRREALKNLALRIGLDDVNSLVALIIQADSFGTSVAQTLRIYSDAMRTKRFQKAEEKAAQLPVKMLIPLIFFILPSLFVVIMGPGILRMIKVMAAMK